MSNKYIIGSFAIFAGIVFGLAVGVRMTSRYYSRNAVPQTVLSSHSSGSGSAEDHEAMCIESGCTWTGTTCDCNTETTSPDPTFDPEPTFEPDSTLDPDPTDDPGTTTEFFSTNPEPTDDATTERFDDGTKDTTSTSSIDRFAQVDSTIQDCFRARLTSFELERLRFLVPSNDVEEIELQRLQEKVQVCFESFSEINRIEDATSEVGVLPEGAESCIVPLIGQTNFDQINNGFREPTAVEKELSKVCFETSEDSVIHFQTEEQLLSTDVESCLALAVGEDRFDDINDGISQINLAERERAERCFGASPHPLQGRPDFELPVEIDSCVSSTIGVARFESIKTGRVEPTESEKEQAAACFASLNDTQDEFLARPPEEVPFLPEDDDLVSVGAIQERVDEILPGLNDVVLVISGEGPPDTLVDVFIFSEPIVVTTETDVNGDWIVELNQGVEGAAHVAYATVRGSSGSSVRSSVFNFQVALAADLDTEGQLLSDDEASLIPSRFVSRALVVVVFGFVIVIIGVAYINMRKLYSGTSFDGGTNRKRDRGDGPGTVN